jgi:riboflavin kinase/FMN adenylyltransferase
VTGSARVLALDELPTIGPAVISMGVFDGVHLGHRAVLEATRAAATARGARSVALVFDPPPEELLQPGTAVPRLAPLDLNLSRIEALGIDLALPIRFDEPLRQLSAETFLEALSPAVGLRGLVMSNRSAFGRDREGTLERMRELAAGTGYAVLSVEPVEFDRAIVSSTRIRAAIADGDLEAARQMGVMPYLQGAVVTGDRRGRDLGFPTANLRFDYAPAMPPLGIYAGRVALAERGVRVGQPSLISIGTRPTFHDDGDVLAEVHLLDFEGDLYDMQLGVELVTRLRDERRFSDVNALVEQMHRDVEMGRIVLGAS